MLFDMILAVSSDIRNYMPLCLQNQMSLLHPGTAIRVTQGAFYNLLACTKFSDAEGENSRLRIESLQVNQLYITLSKKWF